MNATYSIETPRHAPGAIGIVRLAGDALDNDLSALGLGHCPAGSVRLVDILGVDRGLVVRWAEHVADLCAHGGRGVIDGVCERLRAAGVAPQQEAGLRTAWPEAEDEIEARMLEALSRAQSPRAIELLLAQPARWRGRGDEDGFANAEVLRHLLETPLVVIWGPPNVGKSTLLNALARERVGLVADMPGTTRDAVAAVVLLDGLLVRMIDAPGVAAGECDVIVAEAIEIARGLIESADLVLCCGDANADPLESNRPSVRIALRADVGEPGWAHDATVSARTGAGLDQLAVLIRRQLLPDEVLHDQRAWKFW